MDRYEVYLHIGFLDAVPKRGAQRKMIMDFIYGLRERPRTEGDYTDKDAFLANSTNQNYRRLRNYFLAGRSG